MEPRTCQICISLLSLKNLQQLKRNKKIISSNKNKTIPLNEFKKGYKIWKEGTTTFPSGRYLGHHHALLLPDSVQYDDSNTNFVDTMRDIHNTITNIALLNEKKLYPDGSYLS